MILGVCPGILFTQLLQIESDFSPGTLDRNGMDRVVLIGKHLYIHYVSRWHGESRNRKPIIPALQRRSKA